MIMAGPSLALKKALIKGNNDRQAFFVMILTCVIIEGFVLRSEEGMAAVPTKGEVS
ncbi:hypothetical protein K443DRAFT_680919 [Laccaria amethystina LaAM-08-1]|jgi:hypothetical protein|uniref:Uncharacterized protein n=1 Tax=Laccaria amethystina LaAM-08-1 TaxID=1095629 RepID=A0A0C9WZB4_9AGAR|nr:hypothetical protein K443DRAFT_680919 [Laccaria amethystina LaAM-08-1]